MYVLGSLRIATVNGPISPVHPENASRFRSFKLNDISIDVNPVQFLNALALTKTALLSVRVPVKFTHCSNALMSIFCIYCGSSSNPLAHIKPANAYCSITVILFGKIRFPVILQLSNTCALIIVMLLGIVRLPVKLHLLNANSPILVTLIPIVSDPVNPLEL